MVHNELVSEQLPKCIPTIVNGQINPTKKESNNSANNFWDQIHNLVRESTVKVHNDKAKYCKCSKHKFLIVGDSHLRGCAAKLIASLDTCFSVCAWCCETRVKYRPINRGGEG